MIYQVLFVFGVLALLFVYLIYASIRRSQAWEQLASSLGFKYSRSQKRPKALPGHLGLLPIFLHGRDVRIENQITGDSLTAFDLSYVTGEGKFLKNHHLTVVGATSVELALPPWVLRPEGLLDKVGSLVGFQDIDFPSHPKFSKRYVLKSSEPDKARKYFTSSIIDIFEHMPPRVVVEAQGTGFILYKNSRRHLAIKDISQYLETAQTLLNSLRGVARLVK